MNLYCQYQNLEKIRSKQQNSLPTRSSFLVLKNTYRPAPKGQITFDYSNNNGEYAIGSGELMFETKWSKSSDRNIILYNDPTSILTVAMVKDKQQINEIDDARGLRWIF